MCYFILSRWTNWPPQARTICHVLLFLEFVIFILIQNNSGIQPLHLASWQDSGTKHRTEGHFRKKKNSSNQNQSKHCNGTSSWFMNKSSVNRYKWNMIIYQVGMGIRMPMNAQQNDLKQSINEPAVGLYTKRSLPPLFLAWHANFHSSGLTVVLTVRFSSFFPNSHTVAPPVESCFMFIIVYPIGVHLAKEKIPANRNHQSRGHDHNHWIKLLFHPYPLLFFLGGHLFSFF